MKQDQLPVCSQLSVLVLMLLTWPLCWASNIDAQTESPKPDSGVIPVTTIGTGKIESIAYSPDGSEIAVGTTLGVELINASSFEQKDFIPIKAGKCQSIAYSPDGQQIAVAAGEWVWIWDRRTDETVELRESHDVNAVQFGPDGRIYAFLLNGHIDVWDTATLPVALAGSKPARTLHGHRYRVKALAFSPNGALMATGSADYKVRLWDAASGEYVRSLTGAGVVHSVAFTADSRQVVAASEDGVRVWAAESGRIVKTLTAKGNARRFMLVTTAAASEFAIASVDGRVEVWDVTLENRILESKVDVGTLAIAFHPNGRRFITATPYTLKQWDGTSGRRLNVRDTYYQVDAFGFSANSGRLILSARRAVTPAGAPSAPGQQGWKAAGKVLFEGILILWDVPNGEEVHRWVVHQGQIDAVRFSPDGTKIMSWATQENSPTYGTQTQQIIRLWDATTYTELDRLIVREHEQPQYSPMTGEPIIIAPFEFNVEVEKVEDATDRDKDKTYIVMTPDRQVRLWKSPKLFDFNRRAFWPVLFREQFIRAVSKNGHLAATSIGKDIWLDFGAPLPKKLLQEHRTPVKKLQFSFDNKYLVSLSWVGVCLIWNVETVTSY